MGSGSSAQKAEEPQVVAAQAAVMEKGEGGLVMPEYDGEGPPPGVTPGKGKGKGGKKGSGKGAKPKAPIKSPKEVAEIMHGHFKIMLKGEFKDYKDDENGIIKRAYLVGQPNCFFSLRGQDYEYNFEEMQQKNKGTGKQRKIQAPPGMTRPGKPVLPPGPMIVVSVPKPWAKSIEVDDPNNPGRKITVAIPPNAKPGMRMAVPIPAKGENQEEVVKKQQGWSSGTKMAAATVAVGGLAVGGVILGEHLSGGAVSAWGEDAVTSIGEAVMETEAGAEAAEVLVAASDWVGDAADDVGDWAGEAAGDVGEWVGEAGGDAGDWAGEAAGDIGDWGGDALEDVGDWLGDAGEDIGDFVCDLF